MSEQIRESLITISSVPTLAVGADATRLALGFFLPSPSTAAFATNPALAGAMQQAGLPASNTIPTILTRADLRIGITLPWYCIFIAGATQVYAYEVYDPDQPYYPSATVEDAAAITAMASDPSHAGDSPDRLRELLSELMRLMRR